MAYYFFSLYSVHFCLWTSITWRLQWCFPCHYSCYNKDNVLWFFRRLNDPAFTSHFPAILVKPITFECRNLLPLFINDQREEVCYDCLYVVLFLFYCMVIKTLCCFVLTLMTLLYSFESIILQKSMLFSVEVNFTPSFPTYLSPCKKNTHRHTYVLPLLTSRP